MEVIYNGNNDWRDYCLAHHGIMGMHWGIRRFQPYSVTGPRKGGKTGKEVGIAKRIGNGIGAGVKRIKTAHKNRVVAKKRAAALEKARKVKAEKEEIMKSGDAEKLLARKELFSNDDIDKFLTRADKETKVAELKKRQIDAGFQKADEIQEKVKKIAGYVKTANDLAGEGIKLKQNFDQAAELMGASKKKAAEKEADRIANSGSAEEVLNAIRTGKLDASHTQTAKNRLDNQANIEKRILDDGKKAAEEAADRLVNSGSAKEVLEGIRNGSLNADRAQKAVTRLNNEKTIAGLADERDSETSKAISKAIGSADASSISKLWSDMSSSEKKEAFDSVTKKATIDKSIPAKDDVKKAETTDSNVKETSSETRTIKDYKFDTSSGNNNKWSNSGVQENKIRNSDLNSALYKPKRESETVKGYSSDKDAGEQMMSLMRRSVKSVPAYERSKDPGTKMMDLINRSDTTKTSALKSTDAYKIGQETLSKKMNNTQPKETKPQLPKESKTSSDKSNTGPLTLHPNAETRDYNKKTAENLSAISRKASELSKQTRDVDSGEDWVRGILNKNRG